MAEGGTKSGNLIFQMDLDRTKYEKGLQDELAATNKAIDSMEGAWRALGTKSDKYFNDTKIKAIRGYEYIANAATSTAEQIARAAYLGAQKVEAVNAKQFASYASYYQGLIAQAEVANTARNNANAQYWMTKISQDKAMLNAEMAAYEENALRKKVIQDKLNTDNAQWWMQRINQAKIMGKLEVDAYEENTLRKKAIQDKQNLENSDWWMNRINRNRAMLHTESEAWAENAARNKTIQDKSAQDALVPWQTLNIRSTTAIKNQMELTTAAATQLQAQHVKGSQDWLNIEKAKNDQLKHLNQEMVLGHEMSMAAMTRAILRVYAAYYVLSTAAQSLIAPLEKGFKAVETYNQSVASLAAMVVTFSELKPGQNLAEQWQSALKYSTAIVPVLEQIAAKTLLSGEETTALANAFARSGVFLRANNVAQIEGFTRISNALPLMTKGQEIMRQINTEIRSVMTGQNEQSSMMLQTLKALPGFSKENLEIWRQQGTVLENVGKLLEGFGPATALLENQWQAIKTTLDTTVTQILRAGMLGVYGEIILSAKDLNKYLLENKDSLIDGMSRWLGNFMLTMYSIEAEVMRLAMLLDKLGGTMSSAQMLLYGPGRALGVESSTKRFEAAADRNINYENRYKETEKELEKLAIRYNNLEQSISAAGLAAAKLARGAGGGNEEFKAKPAADKALKDSVKDHQESLRSIAQTDKAYYDEQVKTAEQSAKLAQRAGQDEYKTIKDLYYAKKVALNDYLEVQYQNAEEQVRLEAKSAAMAKDGAGKRFDSEKVLQAKYKEIYAKYSKDYNELTGQEVLANEDAAKKTIEIMAELYKTTSQYSDESINAQIKKLEKEYVQKGRYTQGSIQLALALKMEEDKIIQDKYAAFANYYSTIEGYENQYYNNKLKWIDTEQKRLSRLYQDDVAAAKWAAQQKNKFEYDLFKKKTDYVSQGFGDLSTAFSGISKLYAEGSDDAKKWQAASDAMLIAQKAVAVVQAVAAIATQGLGDPYTAFARIAAMAATMGALLASIGETVGSGTSSNGSSQSYQYSSSILGAEAGTASESIQKSWDMMQDTYDMENSRLTGIYNEMKDLNSNITGLVTSIIRTGSVGTIPFEGYDPQTFLNIMNSDFVVTFFSGMFGPITSIFKGINNLFEGLFGGGAFAVGKTELWSSSTGIKLGGGKVSDLMSGSGVDAKSYQEWTTRTTTDFWRDDSYDYNYREQALAESTRSLFDSVFKNMSNILVELSTGLGADVNSAMNYVFEGARINLQGLDSEAITKKLNEYFSEIGDTAVESLFGTILRGYQEVGEGLMETATRLIVDKAIVLDMLETTNIAYNGTAQEAIALSESLISLAGDLDTLQESVSSYYDNFFSDSEKQIHLQANLLSALASINMVLPTTRAGYRSLVEGLNLTTESGQTAYITLMNLSESADSYYTYLEDAMEDVKTAAELAADAIKDMLGQVNDAISEQISLSKSAASAARSAANDYKNIIKSLTQSQESIRRDSGRDYSQSEETRWSILIGSLSGDREALKDLPNTIDQFLNDSLRISNSAIDYARAQGQAMIVLEEAKTVSLGMVNWEEYQASLYETQTGVLKEIKEQLELPTPDLDILNRQAGILETIAGLLQSQTSQIVAGNNTQTLIMQNTAGQVTLANQLTTDQTGQIVLGNSLLNSQIITTAETTAAINSGVNIKSADVIGIYLDAVSKSFTDNNSMEATAVRSAIGVLRQTTSDGLISTAEAKQTTTAITALQNSTATLLAQEVLASNNAMSLATINAANAVQATAAVTKAIDDGIDVKSAITIGQYLTQVQTALANNNSAEAAAARTAIDTLRSVTSSGLATAATAATTTAALANLQSSTASILNQSISLEQSAMSAAATQANSALTAAINVQSAITSGTTAATSSQSQIQTLLSDQTVQIVNGNLIIKDQTGLITIGNKLTTDQTGVISLSQDLTSEQTSQIITGNATSDAIKNISDRNTNYSEEMLKALITGESTQANNLEGILAANTLTVSLIRQLVLLATNTQKEKDIAEITAMSSALDANAVTLKSAQDTAVLRQSEVESIRASVSADELAKAKAEAEVARLAYQQIVDTEAVKSSSFAYTPENYETGTAFVGRGYTTDQASGVTARNNAAYSAYYKEFSEARALMNYSAPDSDPIVASAIQRKVEAENQLAVATDEFYRIRNGLITLLDNYTATYGERPPGYASGGIASGPDSGYLATLHGTELVVSQSNGIPATIINSNNSVIMIDELRAIKKELEEMKASGYQTTKFTQKLSKTLTKFDEDGMPPEREAV